MAEGKKKLLLCGQGATTRYESELHGQINLVVKKETDKKYLKEMVEKNMTGSGQPIRFKDVSGKQYTINPKHRTNVAKSDCTRLVVPETDELVIYNLFWNGCACLLSCYWWAIDKDIEPHLGETDVDKAYIAKFCF